MTAPDARARAEDKLREAISAWHRDPLSITRTGVVVHFAEALLAEPPATAAPGFLCTKCRRVVEASVHVGCNYLAAKLPPAPSALPDEVCEAYRGVLLYPYGSPLHKREWRKLCAALDKRGGGA